MTTERSSSIQPTQKHLWLREMQLVNCKSFSKDCVSEDFVFVISPAQNSEVDLGDCIITFSFGVTDLLDFIGRLKKTHSMRPGDVVVCNSRESKELAQCAIVRNIALKENGSSTVGDSVQPVSTSGKSISGKSTASGRL